MPHVYLLALAALGVCAQTPLTLEEAQSRAGADLTPSHAGEVVTVKGVIGTAPVWGVDSYLVGLRDDAGFGLALQGNLAEFAGLAPGDGVVVTGKLVRRAGMPAIAVSGVQKTGSQTVPAAVRLRPGDLTLRHLGLQVTLEGRVLALSSDNTGDSLVIGNRQVNVRAFLAKTRSDEPGNNLGRFRAGDLVQISGLAVQNCPLPPFNRSVEMLLPDREAVILLKAGAWIAPLRIAMTVAALALLLSLWGVRQRRINAHQRAMRSLTALGEDIISAASPGEILKKVAAAMPGISGATSVRLHVYNQKTRLLDRVQSRTAPEPSSIDPESPAGPLATGAALAFQDRMLVRVPDTRRSPFFQKAAQAGMPRSVMFVPMFAQNELMGVLEIHHAEGIRSFTQEDQTATQHLANQIGTSLKLQEQHSMREHLFRGEKLAATGQLISGVASELRSPLENMLALSNRLLERSGDAAAERELRVLAAEAQRASGIVSRLVSFGRAEESQPRQVEINALMRGLTRGREREWKALGIQVRFDLSPEPLYAMGAHGQLEQVLLNLLVHAEQAAAVKPGQHVTIGTATAQDRVLISITYPGSEPAQDPFQAEPAGGAAGPGLGVMRGILKNQGGDARFSRIGGRECSIEVELPVFSYVHRTALSDIRGGRALTTLVVEPESTRRSELVKDVSAREHRAVPVVSAEEGLDLTQRMRFDIVLCSVQLPGMSWVEFFERVRDLAGAFVLVGDPVEMDAETVLRNGHGYLIERPNDNADMDRVLTEVETFVASRENPVQAGV